MSQDNLWGRGSGPVINVSWQDANEYAQWLSRETGKHYRLPTEAEWEYAAGNGGKEDWAGRSNPNKLSKYAVSMTKQTEPVGSRNPTSFGLYDMSGNAAEWIEDCWHDNYDGAPSDGRAWKEENGGQCDQRVLRGGSCLDEVVDLRTWARIRFLADVRACVFGVRLARDLE